MKINLCWTCIARFRHVLSFVMLLLCVGTLPVIANPAQAGRSITINGVVTDQTLGDPIIGANIMVKGTTDGTITDIDGKFTIQANSDATLVVSYIGFVSKEVEVANSTQLNITLSEDMQNLEEVVVVGYGVQKKKLITGATVQVKGDDIAKLNTVSVLGALQSNTPGVTILKNSGMPGEGFKVNIRGLGTMGDSKPLYIIDGVPGGDIELLNPSDIESIDVLKDAASTAIYGSRAANGVILVTTKTGSKGVKPTVTLDSYVGWQNMYKKAQMLDARQFMTAMDEGRMNDGLPPFDWVAMFDETWGGVNYLDKFLSGEWKGTKWIDELETKNAFQQNHSLGISGGSDNSIYSMGLAYTSQEGVIGGKFLDSKYERYTARANTEYTILKARNFDILKIGQNSTMSFTDRNGLSMGDGGAYSNSLRASMIMYPFMPVYDENGEFHKAMNFARDGNPMGSIYYTRRNNQRRSYSLRTNFHITLQPIEKLILRSSFGINYSNSTYRTYVPVYDLGTEHYVLPGNDKTEQRIGTGYSWVWENTASYDFTLAGSHNFNAMIGTSAEKWGMGEEIRGINVGSEFNDFDHAYLDNNKIIYSDRTTLRGFPNAPGALNSYFGRVNYDYNGTYMATINVRADGSSKFARGNRWGYFPSASAGWVMTNEAFMESTQSWLDFFKLRASWGQNGNMNIDSFQYLASINIGGANYYFGPDKMYREIGSYPDILANADITWEKSEQTDIGFDATFLNSRLGVNFDWYNKVTKDWLVQAPILASYGTGAPYINGGDVRNRGFEVAFNWNDQAGEVRYGANLNFSHYKNKVLRIANADGIINGYNDILSGQTTYLYRAQEGYPIGYFYGYKTDGIFQNEAEVNAYSNSEGELIIPGAIPGDVRFVDLDKNGRVDEQDRTMIGNPHPDLLMGLTLNAAWRGFDIAVTGNGSFGSQIARSYRDGGMSSTDNLTMDIMAGRWHGEGTSNYLPRLTAAPHINWKYISDLYIYSGDYFRISNVTLGYDFKHLYKSLPVQQLRVYASIQNLYTFTKYPGMDPEIGYGGQDWASNIDLGFYPGARTLLIGANIKF